MPSRQSAPVAINSNPETTTVRNPRRGRYHDDNTDSTSIGPKIGLSAKAVLLGL